MLFEGVTQNNFGANGIIFHDVHFDFTLPTAAGNVTSASWLIAIDGQLNVGEWAPTGIPEPVTAALGLMGLGVLGMATRRRAA